MSIEKLVQQQTENRKIWTENDTPENIIEMIKNETAELEEAIREAHITGDVFSVASEIGDVGHLLHRLCLNLGIDLDTAITMKVARNSMKYSDHIMSGEDYDAQVKKAKEGWATMGGDKKWSEAYLNNYSDVENSK
jgi:NTP pyrophosphatase (non-canonical NTP hydrolase)